MHPVATDYRGWMDLILHKIVASLTVRNKTVLVHVPLKTRRVIHNSAKNEMLITLSNSAAMMTTEVVPSPTSRSWSSANSTRT